MSRGELLNEIERLRSVMSVLASYGKNTADLMEISLQLDRLIVEYHKATV